MIKIGGVKGVQSAGGFSITFFTHTTKKYIEIPPLVRHPSHSPNVVNNMEKQCMRLIL